MPYTKEQIETMTRQMKTSPFDPKYVWGLPITPEQQEEYIRVTARANMDGSHKVLTHFGDFHLRTDQRQQLYDLARQAGFRKELKEHWERWEQKYGKENLPDHVRLNGLDAPYPEGFRPPPEYAEYLPAAQVRTRRKEADLER